MLGDHLPSPVTQRRLRAGPTSNHIDRFADWLHGQGYRRRTLADLLRGLAAWSDWWVTARPMTRDPLKALKACRAQWRATARRRYRRGVTRLSLTAASTYIRFLQIHGVIPPPVKPASPSECWPILGTFRSWMRQHRGLTDSTLDVYEGILVDLCQKLGPDPDQYTAETLRSFVMERARPHGIWRGKSIVVAVRAFLRFLGATGRCPAGMPYAIPSFASWQLASVPRFLVPADVERVIASCVGSPHGLRDQAVILLLARLGLRASDVAGLAFDDLDWGNGRLAVCGKTRRAEWLPLSREVGAAIRRYLRQSRPKVSGPAVFTTVLPPFRPLSRACVTHIVRSALRRAGITAPTNGAHVLRHSAATAMLRQGLSLTSIGAVLRHRSPRTTAHYAKVDFDLLVQIAQPWPEETSC